jgi:hypothetical protein
VSTATFSLAPDAIHSSIAAISPAVGCSIVSGGM